MRFTTLLGVACILAAPVSGDVREVTYDHILPRYQTFAETAQTLAQAAQDDCTPAQLLPHYHAAYDAWINISHIQFGPIETRSANLALAFWPDPKDRTGKTLARLIAAQDTGITDPDTFSEVSVAAQGFPALERLLSEDQNDPAYACTLSRAIATHIAELAGAVNADWRTEFAQTLVEANSQTYQNEQEAQRALYTALSTALQFMHDQRIGRPMGTFDRPRPSRAEARRSDRSLRHIVLSLTTLKDFAETAFDQAMNDDTRRAFDTAIDQARGLDDPALGGVADPAKRFKIEVLQRMVRDVQVSVADQIGAPLGISGGFNSLDGD